jgi:hypothetical protein
VQQINLTTQADPRAIAALAGQFPDDSWYDTLLTTGDVFVRKPDGTPLLVVLRQAVQGAMYRAAYTALAPLTQQTSGKGNRGLAAGLMGTTVKRADLVAGNVGAFGRKTGTRYSPIKRDGTVSNTNYALAVPSFVAGYSDRSARFPYCRQTAYTNDHPDRLRATIPCLAHLSQLFATHLPDRHAAQAAQCARTSPDFVIPQTVFTTLTVNCNWQTALHQDAGDLKAGFGVMLCLRAGHYTGGYYTMPQYRIAVDLQAGDVILSDVHEWHANTPLVGNPARYERITVVCYCREKMIHCGTMAEELTRAKALRGTVRP